MLVRCCIALATAIVVSTAVAQVWEPVALPGQFAQGYYLDVFFLPSNPQYGWACGYNGYVVRTTNGGTNWQGSIVPYNGRAGGHLESVHFVDQLNGYASGPCGVFRSTDGGVTWTDITPPFSSEGPWGCYFLSATIGVVLGGGCVGPQQFFRTTNGGQSWSLFQANQPSSGLTDALLNSDGSGYAVSSGLLWQTTDGGASWSVVASTGPNYWNEELTHRGSSFLIPWAGSNCSGQGSGGGARMSTDGGQTWRTFSTGIPLFGAFLHDGQRGWICGFAQQVWYTSDGGQNWQYRGCGTSGDLDDIWMIDDTTGFVVGNGIYRYAPARLRASVQQVDFQSNCPPVLRYDTLWIRNRSWHGVTVGLSISGTDAGAFTIVQPASMSGGIAPCDSLMVVVRYQPRSDGVHQAVLVGTASGQQVSIPLRGEQIGQSVVLGDTLAEVVGVPAGEVLTVSLGVDNRSTQNGQVSSVTRISGATFLLQNTLPVPVPPGGTTLQFSFVPPDTGWYSTRLRIRTEPCSRDTTATLRVYARSPIISAAAPEWVSPCGKEVLDSVRVLNTGNSDLVISSLWIEPLGAPAQIVGTSRGNVPIVVPAGDTVWIRVAVHAQSSGTAALVIEHNDRTLVRNVARPLRVSLQYRSWPPQWQATPPSVDFGTVCVGQSRILFVELANTGSTTITAQATTAAPFALATPAPWVLLPMEKRQIGVSFTPTSAGNWSELLTIGVEPCAGGDTIRLFGRAETTVLTLDPSNPTLRVRVGEQQSVPIVVRSEGSSSSRVMRVRLEPPNAVWQARVRQLPFVLSPGQADTIWLDIRAGSTPMVVTGTLCVAADSLCPVEQCIPIGCQIDPPEYHQLDVLPSAVLFDAQRCIPGRQRRTVEIVNAGTYTETLTAARIEPADAPFALVSPGLPQVLAPGEQLELTIEYAPTEEGTHQAALVLESPAAWAVPQHIRLTGSFVRVQSVLEPARHDLGLLEPCSPMQQVWLTIHARGMLGDTLELVEMPQLVAWQVPQQALRLEIAPNDSATVVLSFDPARAPLEIVATDRFVWESRVCPAQLVTIVTYQVVRPRLRYQPEQFQWTNLMQNTAVTEQIEVVNPSQQDRTIVGYQTLLLDGDGEASISTPLPLVVAAGQRAQLTVTIVPRQVGSFRALIRLIEQSVCTDTTTIWLAATVVQEHYWGRLSIRTHTGLVGDTLWVPVLLSTRDSSADALWRTDPAAIGFTLTFDPFVLEPLGAETGNRSHELPIEVEPGGIVHVRVPRQAGQRLGATDTLAILRLLGLQSPPLRSELHFRRSWVETVKPYTLEHDDGMVILSTCVVWMKVVLVGNVQFWVAPHPIEGGTQAALVCQAEQRQTIRCLLYDSQGELLHQWQFEVENQREEMLPRLPSGLYYLRLESTLSGHSNLLPLLVVR